MMKSRALMMCFLPMAVFAPMLVAKDSPPATAPASRPANPPMTVDATPDLHRVMETMERTIKTIAAQVDDKSKDASTLVAVNRLQVYAALAKSAVPHEIDELPDEAKTKAVAEYRGRMIGVLQTTLALEEAILRGDRAAARNALSKLESQRKDGHAKYDVDDHHH